jgi:hypothetical protein
MVVFDLNELIYETFVVNFFGHNKKKS